MHYGRLKERNTQLLLDDIRSKNQVFRGLPEIINFNHTDVCNLRCIMCFQAYTPGATTIPDDRVKEILHELLPTARKLKLTTAGEPIIGRFQDIVDLTRHYQSRLEIITNATRLTVERYKLMEDILDQLVISLDSHDKDTLDHIRGKGVYDRMMKNMMAIGEYAKTRQKNYIAVYHSVLMTSNVPHLAGFVRFANATGVDAIKVLRMHYMTEELQQAEDPFVGFTKEQLDAHIHEAQDEARRLKVNLILEEVGYDNVESFRVRQTVPPPVETYSCRMMMQEVYIYPNEDVYPCCVPGDLKMGSLKSSDFVSVWNGKSYRRLRKQMFAQNLLGPCANCKMYSVNPDDSSYNYLPGSEVLQGPKLSLPRKVIQRLQKSMASMF